MNLPSTLAWLVALGALAGAVWVVAGEGADATRDGHEDPFDLPGFPRRLDVPGGESIVLHRAPTRLVVANTAVLDAVTALVPPSRVAALCEQAFTWSDVARAPEEWRELPTFSTFLAESVVARDPDLVLCSPHSLPETVASLRGQGVPVLAVPFADDLDDVRENLRTIARALGAEERAAAIERDVDQRIAALRATADRRRGVRVSFYTWSGNEGWSSGSGTLQHVALELAGLENATAAAGHSGPARMTIEQLLALDPDVFVVPAPFGEVVDATRAHLESEPALRTLRAVQADYVVELHPSLFSTTSHAIVTAAEEIAGAVDRLLGREQPR